MIPGLEIAIIDGVIYGLAIILGIVGLVKGFSQQFFALFGTLAVLIGAVLLAGIVADWIQPLGGEQLQGAITSWMEGLDAGVAEGDRWFTVAKDWTTDANVAGALTALGLPAFVSGIASAPVKSVFAEFGTCRLVDVLPSVLTRWEFVAIAFVLLVIVLTIVVALLKNAFRKANEIKLVNGVDKLLGLTLGVAEVYVIALAFFTLLSLLPNTFLPEVQDAIRAQIELSTCAKWLNENNWLSGILMGILAK